MILKEEVTWIPVNEWKGGIEAMISWVDGNGKRHYGKGFSGFSNYGVTYWYLETEDSWTCFLVEPDYLTNLLQGPH